MLLIIGSLLVTLGISAINGFRFGVLTFCVLFIQIRIRVGDYVSHLISVVAYVVRIIYGGVNVIDFSFVFMSLRYLSSFVFDDE